MLPSCRAAGEEIFLCQVFIIKVRLIRSFRRRRPEQCERLMLGKRQFVVFWLGPLLALELSCEKKPVKTQLPPAPQPPTLTQTLPYEIQPEEVPAPPSETAQAEEPAQKPPPKKRPRTARKPATTSNGVNVAPAAQAAQGKPGSGETTSAELRPPANPVDAASEVAIGPDVSSPQAKSDRQSTNQLLDATENDLKHLDSRSLSADQQGMLNQIRAYISQSRKALTEGDYERASNLAKKAQLLTGELIKK
jgi:hypothetical protein